SGIVAPLVVVTKTPWTHESCAGLRTQGRLASSPRWSRYSVAPDTGVHSRQVLEAVHHARFVTSPGAARAAGGAETTARRAAAKSPKVMESRAAAEARKCTRATPCAGGTKSCAPESWQGSPALCGALRMEDPP